MTEQEKISAYHRASEKINALLAGEQDVTACMASICAVLAGEFETFYWTGFYRMLDGELVIGPYQGTPGCLRISLNGGVCGAAVRKGETLVVENVKDFPGHIACDAKSQSEIVVPVWDALGNLMAVLDIDSEQVAAFDAVDRVYLERICADVFSSVATECHRLV